MASTSFVDNNDYAMTLRYPLKAPIASGEDFLGDEATGATGMIDYLKIKRKRTSYSTNGKNYYGSNANFITGAESVEGDLNSGTLEKHMHIERVVISRYHQESLLSINLYIVRLI